MPKMDSKLGAAVSKATKYLQGINHVEMMDMASDMRCVNLNLQTIFDELVSFYILLFKCQKKHLESLLEMFAPPLGVSPWDHAARVYISAWIHDLYVSNCKAVRTLCGFDIGEHYYHESHYYSSRYDAFLIHLNAAIRPTHIRGTAKDTVYIPILHDSPAWGTDNPFNIENFVMNRDLLSGLLMRVQGWRMSTIVSDNRGRPTWLFDWHDDKCCAWFPSGNYTMEDVTVAYIVGAACTPNLGPRDVDVWQNGTVPGNSRMDYKRIEPRRFYGDYEVRTFEQRQVLPTVPTIAEETTQGPLTKRQKTTLTVSTTATSKTATASGSKPSEAIATVMKQQDAQQLMVSQFKITDWTYYHNVVQSRDYDTRSLALCSIMRSDFIFFSFQKTKEIRF